MNINELKLRFSDIFESQPLIVKSPGRINIIGEHTDYNDGFVMPAAINKAIYVALSKRADTEVHLYAENYKQLHIVSLENIVKSEKGWANYVLGVIDQLQKNGYILGGFNLYLTGDVPLGAGLSSSAALECAVAHALNHTFSLNLSKMDLVLTSQKAEHEFAGVNCGIMDQFASVFGREGHAMLLDCRSVEHEYIPLDLKGHKFILFNTNVKHKLSESAYNQRRSQCELGVELVKANNPEVKSLRDTSLAELEEFVKPVDRQVYEKCRYVIEEIDRTKLASDKLKQGDLAALGKLMFQTHSGLSKIYEVSCPELDFLVDQVSSHEGVLGSRMMGGGFGGCTINLIRADQVDELTSKMISLYQSEFGISLDTYVVESDEGTSIVY
ncbi:galactokinase [Pedobacter lithocola]|uniref:Galactokinase n=1 Tax=Pedobacter lithocola TaxID=1908239 RepID=A0ABV8P3P1_9SPHI